MSRGVSAATLSTALALGAALLAGCAMGPRYQPAAPVPAGTQVGTAGARGATRVFFDSLATARAADSAPVRVAGPAVVPMRADSLGDVAWLAVLRDTTLVGLVRTALRQNRDLQGAVARIREFRALAGIARAPLFPTLSADASAGTNKVNIGTGAALGYDALRVTGNVAWELDFWGRTRRGLEAAQADLAGQEAARQAVALTLVSDVAGAYLQLLELEQERIVAESTLVSRQATLALARSRFRQGLTSELDVWQFEAQVSAPAATLAQVERLRAQREHQLSVLIGEAPRRFVLGGSLVDAVAALDVPDSLPAALLARRPDVRQAERAVAAATARIGVAQAARLPSVSITGYYGTQSATARSLFDSGGEVYQLQGGVSLPLFTGGRLANESRAAEARAEQSRAQYEQTALGAMREAGDALVVVRTARDEAAAQQTQAQALRRALQLAEMRYRSGVASYVEVLDAQRGLFSAELALSQAQLQQLNGAVQLYKALGGSWRE